MKNSKTRADIATVQQGIAVDNRQAASLILSGVIVAKHEDKEWRVEKAGELLPEGTALRRKSSSSFVSRGGEKLLSAIQSLHLSEAFVGKKVLDVGASTGGFTDCVLSLGAASVVAVDVGRNQLAWRLRQDKRVMSLEGTHICDADVDQLGLFDWVLADISFNSLSRLLPCLVKFGCNETRYLLLVKPQFELARGDIPDGGVVINDADREKAIAGVRQAMVDVGITVIQSVDSGVTGRAGNREIFVLGNGQ